MLSMLNKLLESDYADTIFYYQIGGGGFLGIMLFFFNLWAFDVPLTWMAATWITMIMGLSGVAYKWYRHDQDEKKRLIIHYGKTIVKR